MTSPSGEQRAASAAFLLVFVVPLTVYLGAPPIVNQTVAQQECEELAETRLAPASEAAEVRWEHRPLAHWDCVVDDRVVADLGWFTTSSTDTTAILR